MEKLFIIQEEPTRKKPVGGVSMFGGVNPFADRLKKSDNEENKTEPSGSKKTLKSGTLILSNISILI